MLIANCKRRTFLQSLSAFAALRLSASSCSRYVLSAESIDVVAIQGGQRFRLQRIASRGPSALAFHPSGRFLYVTNDVAEHENLPRGTLEAYAIDGYDGRLKFLARQPLSLSATNPRAIAIAPSGSHLVVAAYSGGIYNLLPIGPDGVPRSVTGIFKELGRGPCSEQLSAHPHSLAFDSSGRYLISTDFGCDRISVFTFHGGALERTSHIVAPPGSGPGRFTFDAAAARLSVVHELTGRVSQYRMKAGILTGV
ncbi:MAG TPA: beta-propeller fold lactonase family protein [Bryobacteraceae bacterium]|jgi:6-phosphogluconolactonase (cycloisomerase 2 family)